MHEDLGSSGSYTPNPRFAAFMATFFMAFVVGVVSFWYFLPDTFYIVCMYTAMFAAGCLALWALVKVWQFLYELFL